MLEDSNNNRIRSDTPNIIVDKNKNDSIYYKCSMASISWGKGIIIPSITFVHTIAHSTQIRNISVP